MSNSGARRAPLSAKAILHQKYGDNARYKVEEIPEPVENECPGLTLLHQNKVRVFYQCHLQLPGLSVTSEKFSKKKDAEQSAAKMALEKLGIQATLKDPTPEEAWNELVARISSLFSEKFLLSGHPMVGHLQAAIGREGETKNLIPISVIAAYDSKILSLSKFINPKAESDPLLVMSLILNAARSMDYIRVSRSGLWMGRKDSYSSEALQSLIKDDSSSMEHILARALFIPGSIEKPIETLTLELSPGRCYIDKISQKLGVEDSSHVLVSRPVGRTSSERRFYFSSPKCHLLCFNSSSAANVCVDDCTNLRALCFSGQNIGGNAILATISYTWKSRLLFCEDVTLSTYYRMLLGLTPDGCYKLSREAMLAAKLPSSFTTKSNWRGQLPRDLLCTFCRNHRLMEPQFCVKEIPFSEKRPKTLDGLIQMEDKANKSMIFACEVKILSKQQGLILECLGEGCKKQADAIQKAALSVLLWLNSPFKTASGICVDLEKFSLEFSRSSPLLVHLQEEEENLISVKIEGSESGSPPLVAGSLVSVSYSVTLANDEEHECQRLILDCKEEFEFEFGSSGVIDCIESCVSQMCVGQSALFVRKRMPFRDLVLAAAGESAEIVSRLDLWKCWLEYSLKLLQISEPNEDRMERALFNPSLSKQRVDFALGLVNSAHATTLVDFGCGSGSLLDSLMDHQTTLEKIVGVDISQRSLCRAAKILHSKLTKKGDNTKRNAIKSAMLYDGSITEYDSRLQGFDVGTCLEVIEHMEEEQAAEFGHMALSLFCPKLLIVSTPNYEYNPLLQAEEDRGEKSTTEPARFRNHDHKFEWTRAQFEHWAVGLASKHSYSVDFGGVGGSGDVDPGFASQIAIFRRSYAEEMRENDAAVKPYEIIWEWPRASSSG